MSFQKTVLIVSLIVLSVMLFFIALAMRGLKQSQGYPPEIAECPDYWTKDTNGKCTHSTSGSYNTPTPKNSSTNCSEFPRADGLTSEEVKKKFSDDCTLEWDGITNIN